MTLPNALSFKYVLQVFYKDAHKRRHHNSSSKIWWCGNVCFSKMWHSSYTFLINVYINVYFSSVPSPSLVALEMDSEEDDDEFLIKKPLPQISSDHNTNGEEPNSSNPAPDLTCIRSHSASSACTDMSSKVQTHSLYSNKNQDTNQTCPDLLR